MGGILCFLSPFLYFFKIISKGLCPFIKRKSSKALFILKMIMISFHLEVSFHLEMIATKNEDKEKEEEMKLQKGNSPSSPSERTIASRTWS